LKGEPKRLKPLWLHRNILEDNIEMGLKWTTCDVMADSG
jgi:hypothetical protein